MKFICLTIKFTLILLSLFFFTKADDWTHNDDYNLENNKEKVKRVGENYDIGIALPWLSTTRYSLATIPKNILVSGTKADYYVCRATIKGSRIKVVGKLKYSTQMCYIPTTTLSSLPLDHISTLPNEKRVSNFEVLTNPLGLNLMYVYTSLRQGTNLNANDRIMPARPVLADSPQTSGLARKGKAYPLPFIAYLGYRNKTYMGVVQEVSENGTLAFYHGLLNIQNIDYRIKVLAVLNTKKPAKTFQFVG